MISTYVPILPVGNVTELNRHLDVRRWDQTTKGNWQLGAREVPGKQIKNGVLSAQWNVVTILHVFLSDEK